MELDKFTQLRTHAYHLTNRGNLKRILQMKVLESASSLYMKAGLPERTNLHRGKHEIIQLNQEEVHIRDQRPLMKGHIDLSAIRFEDVVRLLNQHVFFWPGNSREPIKSGRNHFSTYASQGEDCMVLIIPTDQLLVANTAPPKFSRCNSGAPRTQQGRKQLRDKQTFRHAGDFEGTPGTVIEMVFEEMVTLPPGELEIRELGEFKPG